MAPYSHWGNLRVIRYRSIKVISFSTLNSIDLTTHFEFLTYKVFIVNIISVEILLEQS